MAYFIGIDCGTQGTKAVVFDEGTGKVIAKGYAKHDIIQDDTGLREQKVEWWIDALVESVKVAMSKAGINKSDVKGLAVSGQQHGLVVLGENGDVLHTVKLWNDTSTAGENNEILQAVGGMSAVWQNLGTTLPVGYTASKIKWLSKHKPEVLAKVRHVLLPHDYINFWLTGEYVTDASEASGTGYYDVNTGDYSQKMMSIIDTTGILAKSVPAVYGWEKPVGTLRKEVAEKLGLSENTLVAPGGGDNTMGAIGTAALKPHRASMGLGTSGTIAIMSDAKGENIDELLQLYNLGGAQRLITACTLNATSATTSVQNLFGISVAEFDERMESSPVGSNGVCVVPFFGGERMPPLPNSQGFFKNLTALNCKSENIIRATAEAVIYTLKWGYDKISRSFGNANELIVTGGGANSKPWSQIVADVFDLPLHFLQSDEGGALGAAIQAMYTYKTNNGDSVTVQSLCDKYILFNEEKHLEPIQQNVSAYKEFFAAYKHEISKEWGIKV